MADIATEIQNLSARISTAYDVVAAKGGTVPATKDTYHLSAAIDSIPAGGGEMPELFGVPLDALTPAVQYARGAYMSFSISNDKMYNMHILSNDSDQAATRNDYKWLADICKGKIAPSLEAHISSVTIDDSNFYVKTLDGAFAGNKNIKAFTYTGTTPANYTRNLFQNCTNLSSVQMDRLNEFGGQNHMQSMFAGCTALSTVTFPAVRNIRYDDPDMFNGSGVREINMPQLTSIAHLKQMFRGATQLTAFNAPNLRNIPVEFSYTSIGNCYEAFRGCSSLSGNPLSTIANAGTATNCLSACWAGTAIQHFDSGVLSANAVSAYNQALSACHNLKTANIIIGGGASLSVTQRCMVSCFIGCENLESLSVHCLPNGYNAAQGITFFAMVPEPTQHTAVHIYGLKNLRGGTGTLANSQEFAYCKGLGKVYLHDLENLTNPRMFAAKSQYPNLTEVHFRADKQSYWTAHAGYATAFGLGAGTVNIYFDL